LTISCRFIVGLQKQVTVVISHSENREMDVYARPPKKCRLSYIIDNIHLDFQGTMRSKRRDTSRGIITSPFFNIFRNSLFSPPIE
jgi:hypothetical protein